MDSKNNISRTFKKEVKMKPKKKANKPLTKREQELLMKTPMNAFSSVFPNHTRPFLILAKKMLVAKTPLNEKVSNDMAFKDARDEANDLKSKNDYLMSEVKKLSNLLKYKKEIENTVPTLKIEPSQSSGTSEATAVVLLSDWHIDEVVDAPSVNYLNRFDYNLAEKRVKETFQVIAKMLTIHKRDIEIKELVLALLGDFISSTIHDDLKEGNSMSPMKAVIKTERLIHAGITFLLENTDVNLTIVCSVGNHSRITKEVRMSTEQGNALETIIYDHLAFIFENEPRIKFVISEGYHSYVDVYSYTLRFHHGHAIKYGGGIGGLFIPVYKAISQWNKAKRADLDCFGHFHQMKDGGNFMSNGSLIGYNAFALRIKADYEKPKQVFFLIDKKRGKTVTIPIVLNGD